MKPDEEGRRVFPTMKPLNGVNAGNDVSSKAEKTITDDVKIEPEKIDFSKVEIEPLFKDFVDFETFSKSDFRAVKVLGCEAVPKSKKLLKFTLDDGTGENRTILSGIHAYYEPEELIGKDVYKRQVVDRAGGIGIFNLHLVSAGRSKVRFNAGHHIVQRLTQDRVDGKSDVVGVLHDCSLDRKSVV